MVIPETLLIRLDDGRIEEMTLEEYVQGVVPGLTTAPAPQEALKALAIAVRSEAIVSRRHARDSFDLCTTPHCLVWEPASRTRESDQAVYDTKGQVVSVNGRIVAAPFFAQCDGHTRNSEEVWAGRVGHCRSVVCSCGSSELKGHGVGLCLKGALALALQGAAADEILMHYYTGIDIAPGTTSPRAALRQSLILGRVSDGQGRPRPDVRLVLTGPEGALEAAPTLAGRFWFSDLGAGRWELKVKGQPVRHGDLLTDGRNTVEVEVVVQGVPPLAAQTIPLAHPRQLVGTLGYDGETVTIADSAGREQTVISGSVPEFNPGGFAVPLPPAGPCTIRCLDQSFVVEIGDTGLWVRFVATAR